MTDDITRAETLIDKRSLRRGHRAPRGRPCGVRPTTPSPSITSGRPTTPPGTRRRPSSPTAERWPAASIPRWPSQPASSSASTLRNLGETRESVEILEAAVAEHPQHRAARMFLALALVSDDRATDAVRILLDLHPHEPRPARALRAIPAQLHGRPRSVAHHRCATMCYMAEREHPDRVGVRELRQNLSVYLQPREGRRDARGHRARPSRRRVATAQPGPAVEDRPDDRRRPDHPARSASSGHPVPATAVRRSNSPDPLRDPAADA